ncbi:serpentine type 7TM GPCR chemoreceptor srx domain-containing protein [Ditylenchus destructor]|nr:serpentine type 7TM GPCR chemoreceptor srx domain-containing protein [Ditylenchus destructor]
MLSIGIADAFQILALLVMGLGMTFDIEFDGMLEEILGAMLYAAFITVIMQHVVLALNRFLVFRNINVSNDKSTKEWLCFNLLIFLCWAWATMFCVIYLSPICCMEFDDSTYMLAYNKDMVLCNVIKEIDFYTTAPAPVIGLFIYLLIIYKLIKNKQEFNAHNSPSGVGHIHPSVQKPEKSQHRLFTSRELGILIQSFTGFIFAAIIFIAAQLRNLEAFQSCYFSGFVTVLWIMFCAIQPIMYLIMNSKIRRRSLLLLMCSTENGRLGSRITFSKKTGTVETQSSSVVSTDGVMIRRMKRKTSSICHDPRY